jgi:hypothetical protein
MKVFTVFIVAGGLFLASCSPDGQAANAAGDSEKTLASAAMASDQASENANNDKEVNPAASSPNAQPSSSPMKDHELLAYFQPSDANMFVTCTDEKGPSDDYSNGKLIPMSLVEKYELFQFNMSPPLGLKYRLPNALVTVKGNAVLTYQDQRILVYTVGIGMESEDAPVDEGVDIRVLATISWAATSDAMAARRKACAAR